MPFKSHLVAELADPEMRDIYAHVLGTADVNLLARRLSQPFRQNGFQPAKILFSAVSVGAVFGVENATDEKLVLKIFPARHAKASLEKLLATQKLFAAEGFPAPPLRSGLLDVLPGVYGVLMDYVAGEEESGHDPAIRHQLAQHLAWLADISTRFKLPAVANPFAADPGRIWPVPHKPNINLGATVRGSKALYNRAVRARHVIDHSGLPTICAHSDWGVKNTRFRGKKIVAIFDWDSLYPMSEAQMVGQAAGQFTAHWGIDTKLTPLPEEAEAFVEEYQDCRGQRFSKLERRVASAAADYIIAVIARFELAAGKPTENSFYTLTRELRRRALIKSQFSV